MLNKADSNRLLNISELPSRRKDNKIYLPFKEFSDTKGVPPKNKDSLSIQFKLIQDLSEFIMKLCSINIRTLNTKSLMTNLNPSKIQLSIFQPALALI